MLASAVAFWQIVLAVQIAAVVVAFDVTFAYPLIELIGSKLDPRAQPRRVAVMSGAMSALVLITVYLMTVRAGA